jgi:hypothetical protein
MKTWYGSYYKTKTTKEKILEEVSDDSKVAYETVVWAFGKLNSYDKLFKLLAKSKTVDEFVNKVEKVAV